MDVTEDDIERCYQCGLELSEDDKKELFVSNHEHHTILIQSCCDCYEYLLQSSYE